MICPTEAIVNKVIEEVDIQLKELPRQKTAEKALKNSLAVVIKDRDTAVELINEYAPEHLILNISDEEKAVAGIVNAGSVFIGNLPENH